MKDILWALDALEKIIEISTWLSSKVEPSELQLFKSDIAKMVHEGWTVEEMKSLFELTEHVNPNLPEDAACARMESIRAVVKARRLEREKAE